MSNWFNYFKSGLSRKPFADQIGDQRKADNLKQIIQKLFPYLKPHWQSGVLGASLIIMSSLMAFPQPLIYRFLIDDVILAKQIGLLPWAILLLGGVYILNKGIALLQQYYVHNFEEKVILDIQKSLLDHTLHLPKVFFDQQEVGYLISRISSDVQNLRWFFSGTVVYLFTNLIRFFGGLGFLFYLEWRLALTTLIFLPILLVSAQYFSKHTRRIRVHGMETQATIMKHLQETIASVHLIKTFSNEARESERVGKALEEGRQISIEQTVVNSVARLVINVVPDLAKAIVLVIGAYLAIQGEWTLGSLLAFQSFLGYVFGPALFLADSNISLQNSLVALGRVMSLFEIVPEDNLETGRHADELTGEITFEEVSFSYGGDEPVLKDISFTINPGEHIAIVGPSGVGKTTLVSLLLCFYQPSRGQIRFDNLPLSEYNLPSIRKHIGYVSQSTLLLSGTFNENLCYGYPEATQQEVEQASKAAGIHDFILSLPKGYGSRIDERGVNLSEGQKQRLSIARALIKNPDILILDEPTAALDSIVERSIFEALPTLIKGKTLILVAHRLASIQDSDRILLLNEKQLVGVGTHSQLLAQNEFYRRLVANQQVIGPV